MSYPQPPSADAVLGGQQYFRLKTPLVSDGDIYQSVVGANGFALGPESDVAKVAIGYLDTTQLGNLGIAVIDPARAFVGRVDAHNEQGAVYTPSNLPGQIYVWPLDLYNPSYHPFPLATSHTRVDFITPILDVIQYFVPMPSLTPQRNDKAYHYQSIPWYADVTNNGNAIVVPYYGRKYGNVSFTNFTNSTIDVGLVGVRYFYANNSLVASETTISAQSAVAGLATKNMVVRASVDGMYDALTVIMNNFSVQPAVPSGPVNLRITVSDQQL